MDFDDTKDEAEYRARARTWLAEHAPRAVKGHDEATKLAAARAWQKTRANAGYACITWPKEWGGPGGSPIQRVIYEQEEEHFGLPSTREFYEIGLGFCVPTIIKFSPADQVDRFVRPAMLGDEIWCQLFSEPAAGSDLAGLRMRGEKDGSDWLVTGQKVWTSGAHFSDWGLLLVRTDPSVPKHKGLTMFWVDMKAPGIEIRPIHQMSGAKHFNEVYFNEVRIPDAQRVGPVGGGWNVALVTLMNERVSGGTLAGPNVEAALALAKKLPAADGLLVDEPAFRAKLAQWYVHSEGLRLARLRTLTALSRGETPGPESSIGKLVAASTLLDIAHEVIEAQGEYGLLTGPDEVFQHSLLHTPGLRIAGGTDEILRNIIAERVLGLPGDARVDKDVPFTAIPTGS